MPVDFIWSEKYRPTTVEATILPAAIKKTFQGFLKKKDIPNLLASGASGMGKTTVALALAEELGCEWLLINGSDEGRSIETLRGGMTDFVNVSSGDGKRKVLIIDEADSMLQPIQLAMRRFMDRYSKTTSFVLTCNSKQMIIDALQSRLTPIEFIRAEGDESVRIMVQLLHRACEILTAEGVSFQKEAVAALIEHYYPDFRKTLNMLQKYAAANNDMIDSGILGTIKDASIKHLSKLMRGRDFTGLYEWAALNREASGHVIRSLHDQILTLFATKEDSCLAAKLIQEHQKWETFCADQQVHLLGTLSYLMTDCQWR